MGRLEETSKRLVRKTRVQEAVLLSLVSGGRKGGDILIKEAINHLLHTDFDTSPRTREIIKTSANRLSKKGLVEFKNGHYSLTPSGQKTLEFWELSNYKIKRPKKWDGKWRIVIFDIPERKKAVRKQVTHIIREAGLVRLQDSVWVFPYDCEDVIGLLKTDFGIGRELLYIIADQIENDKYLRMEFDLF